MKRTTQKEMVLNHLQVYGNIEPLTALREYGCYRLGAIIFLLRKDGHDITSNMIEARSHITGRRVRFANYTLHGKS
jgi:hypothetical protein